jgi:hypothetical protein
MVHFNTVLDLTLVRFGAHSHSISLLSTSFLHSAAGRRTMSPLKTEGSDWPRSDVSEKVSINHGIADLVPITSRPGGISPDGLGRLKQKQIAGNMYLSDQMVPLSIVCLSSSKNVSSVSEN